MKTNMKSIISLALAFALVISCIPGTALVTLATEAATTYDKPTGRAIAVNYDGYMADSGKDWAEELLATLPANATIDGAGEYAITWPTADEVKAIVDPDVLGYYAIPGSVEGVEKAVTITIQVYEAANVLHNPSFETNSWNNADGWGGGYYARRSTNVETTGWVTPTAADGAYSFQIQTNPNTATASTQLRYQTDAKAVDLAAAVKAAGEGQYYLGISALDSTPLAEGGADYPEHEDSLFILPRIYVTEGTTVATAKSYAIGTRGEINRETWSKVGSVFTLTDLASYNWLRTDFVLVSDTAYTGRYVFLDMAEMIPLNVPLKAEPTETIVAVNTELPALAIAKDYDVYAGENWQNALGLPATVEITTDKSEAVAVDVIWDYSKVNFAELGAQTITGKLSAPTLLNDKGLTVVQRIYVNEAINLFTNGGFEDDWAPNWSGRYNLIWNQTPSAEGYAAVGVQSSAGGSWGTQYPMLQSTNGYKTNLENTNDLAAKVAELGAGQYYVGGKVKDYVRDGEETHADPLSVFIRLSANADGSTTWNSLGESAKVTINHDNYVTVGKTFDLTGTEKSFYTELYLYSTSTFYGQWILVDDMQFIPLKVAYVEPAECAHEWDEGVVDPAATCTKDGVITYTCTLCNETKTDVIPATGEHAWDEGVIKPDATCTEEGVKTYTCGTCGETKTEAVSALGHTKAEPVVENEKAPTCVAAGSYDSVIYCSVCKAELSRETIPGDPATGEHTYEDGKCTECGAEEPVVGPILDTNLSLALKALVLDSYIGAQFIVNPKVTGYDNIYITVSADGAEPIAYTETIDSRYYAYTHGVAPKNMNVEMEIIVYGEKDGKLYAGVPETWSVKGGIIEMLDKYYKDRNSDVKMMQRCVLLVDMLYYGAAAQTRFGATAHGLATDDLNPDYAALRTVVDAELTVDNTTVSNEGDQLALYSLGLEDQVDLQFIFKLAVKDQSLYTIKVTYGDKVKVYGPEDFAETSSSYAAVVFSELGANAMRDTVSVALFKGETQVSETYVASIAGTAKALIEKGGVNVALAKAMMIYGDSAAAFLAK